MASRSTVEVNNTVFQSFGPDTTTMKPSTDNNKNNEEGAWQESGAFPTSGRLSSDHLIFTDEPSYDSSLEVVQEEGSSTSETLTKASREARPGVPPQLPVEAEREQEPVLVSASSSAVTPAVDNTGDGSQRKNEPYQQQHFGIDQNHSMNSSSTGGHYPYNMYQSFSNSDEKRREGDTPGSDENPKDYPQKPRLNKISRGIDKEESSLPPQITPMSLEEETASAFTADQHSAGNSIQPSNGMLSVRSRRHGKRNTVRNTMPSSQQINAKPATMLKNLFLGIEEERHMHKLTAINFHAIHNWLLFLPAILLTLLSGLVVLVFEADLNTSPDMNIYASIFVGTAAFVSVFWQAIGKQLDLGSRAALHDATANALKRLSEDILLTLSSTDVIPAEYVALISEKFGQALDACPSTVPLKLEIAFTAISDRLLLMMNPPMGQAPRKPVEKLDYMRLYATAYDELTTEIISHWAWPFKFPRPRGASETALRNFKVIVTEGREVRKRKGCLRICCPCLCDEEEERSLFDIIPAVSVASNFNPHNQRSYNDPHLIRSHMLGAEI